LLVADHSAIPEVGQLHVGPHAPEVHERDTLEWDSNNFAEIAGDLGDADEAAMPASDVHQRLDVGAREDQSYQAPYESVADRVADIVSPVVASLRAYTPAWREFFRRRERNWRQSYWYRELRVVPRLITGLLFIIVASTFAIVVATKAATLSPSAPASARVTPPLSGGIVLQQSPSGGTPTAAPSDYLIGVWISDASPPTSGSVQIFVRVTHASQAEAGIPVSISVALPGGAQTYGSIKTDGYGLATFTAIYRGTTAARPVFITATATVGGKKLTQQTYFVPR
jgi:hypothetical protein